MRTVFITIDDPAALKNIFGTKAWSKFLRSSADARLVLLTRPGKKEEHEKFFAAPNITVEALNPAFGSCLALIAASLARSGIKTHTNLWSKMRSYERGDSSFLATIFKRAYTFLLGGSSLNKIFLRRAFLGLPPAKATASHFEKYQPSLLFAVSLTNIDFDVPIAVEAKRRGVRIVGLVRSWDNFSSHGLTRVVPDRLILQNKFLKEMAERHQAITEKDVPIDIIGLPHYDIYAGFEKMFESRESFFRRMGLDSSKKLILYGAMGDFLFPNECGVADVFEELIESRAIRESSQVLFRAHPKFNSPLERIKGMKHVKPDKDASNITGDFMKHLVNSIYHSDLVVAGASTIVIDAVMVGKPVICIGFDPVRSQMPQASAVLPKAEQTSNGVGGTTKKVSYWTSVKRFYDSYTHFEALMETGRMPLANTKEELTRLINEAFGRKSYEGELRQKVIDLFVAPFDGQASERLARIFTEELRRIRNG